MEETSSSSCVSPPPPPRSTTNQTEFWKRAEESTRVIIEQVHPTLVSEDRRRDVIDFVQRLVKITLGCEVYTFGSVPLKTYLPDGDIDLTVFGGPCHDEELALRVFSVLEREQHNGGAEFIVKDVQLIRAEVKLVKCLVQNIVVDISFNQLGGICTLCFLEKVDHLIGKDHLFKRSIILIKAWCYYESRILGALHGLISTYALETLVLYIFHLFHSSLNGPLGVLYKFLDYFSKFDWDNYCLSLNGPVCLSSLPEIIAETPENGGQDLLLTSEFLKECLEMYYVPSRGFEANPRVFPSKYLNIVDPLKENNNLGRSVSKGNFYRIRTAFTYGARKLGQVILQPEEDISFELRKFFSNMLHRHESGQRPDVSDDVPLVRCSAISPASNANHIHEAQGVIKLESFSSSGYAGNGEHDQEGSLYTESNLSSTPRLDLSGLLDETTSSVTEERFAGDAEYLVSRRRVKDIHSNGNDNELVGYEDLPLIGSLHHTCPQEDMHLQHSGHCIAGLPNLLSDLTGDYDSQINSLQYGRWWFDYVQNGLLSPLSPHGLSQITKNNSWEVNRHALPFNANGAGRRPGFFHVNRQLIPGTGFVMEESPKPRGTGTYFPNANHYRERPFSSRGRNSHQARSPHHNGRNMARERQHHHHHHHYHHPNQTNGYCDMSQTDSPESFSDTNGSANHQHDFRSTEPLQAELLSFPEGSNQRDISNGGYYNQSQCPNSIPSSTEEARYSILSLTLKTS
ncbi:unnamed protein product [Cochlearia groenlandica]